MAKERNTTIEAAAKLITLTQQGKLKWDLGSEEGLLPPSSEHYYGNVFTADYKGRRLRLFRRYTKYKDDPYTFNTRIFIGQKPDWIITSSLQLIDEDGKSLWSFPNEAPLDDLLVAVQYQRAGVKEFIDSVLAEG